MKTKIIVALVFFITLIQNAYGIGYHRTYIPRVHMHYSPSHHSRGSDGDDASIIIILLFAIAVGIILYHIYKNYEESKKNKKLEEDKRKKQLNSESRKDKKD
ncbi:MULTISPECIES: hypothetical protein [unclassified Gilliamella]|uniref:hypothetical protein n=1 Tax=unclassified Gilliamella TaxID=2685620 RepID=UPI00226A9814|nr:MULTISPECIES: hypothetical protein [unclassified Gilliamella]MCX8595740.1 hypothetical protein [Gilliamella sp. B3493]MCX8599382.1 hypothetical protein [Gilliamella sp. B3486]MCX8689658.1 hypothetical protein [Gilliamella sp. B2973]MCX8705371.1 hypothetical protein [Gilliamella sp. B3127]